MKNSVTVLVTGGAGYIGSHAVVELLNLGYTVVVVDDLSNSQVEVLRRIELITGKTPYFHQVNICDKASLDVVFGQYKIDCVIHFAGFKAVGESVAKPLSYYHNNVYGSMVLLEVMQKHFVRQIIFSSSATVYGVPEQNPIEESLALNPFNPYGHSKAMVEQMLQDLKAANDTWSIAILRYFNPIGAHSSGLIGEDPKGIPNNLMPYITQVALGKLPYLSVYGNDYATHDGTGVRDYIHVVDLVIGHIKVLEYFTSKPDACQLILNLGTGKGYSVLDVISAFEMANQIKIPYKFMPRRGGDIDIYYANPKLASSLIDWKTQYELIEMCRDSWKWQQLNPQGYQ